MHSCPSRPLSSLFAPIIFSPATPAPPPCCLLQTRRADQQRALQRLRDDSELGKLQLIEAPLFDLEVGLLAWLGLYFV